MRAMAERDSQLNQLEVGCAVCCAHVAWDSWDPLPLAKGKDQ